MSPFNCRTVVSAVLVAASLMGAAALAQTPRPGGGIGGPAPVDILPIGSAPAQTSPSKAIVPLKVQVTISRYEGDKKTSSLPFSLWVNANDEQTTTLTTGQNVPFPSPTVGSAIPTFTYQNVGTNITARADRLDDGRFNLRLTISDSSVVPAKDKEGHVSLKSLQTNNRLVLRDGQNAEFLAASDKVNGEVTRIEVTVTVLK